ncbi:NlpC/P60 family protein [Streptomyces guryensis]|uniref:NlpC/P60 family protein n=1 Tax=Streptomyces guryensis TaxID=2886947 RepID=A0A9Q3VRR2_9ACTN|nr:NlpC/P60 family protein [Streptomyces guryensis]MCD9875990.1 NlpC/P60 family protein [Streptomyces guryensis]
MAPDRPSRTGGFGLPGMRNSALATAALTSVALFSQTADAAPTTADEGPSREAVRQRVSSLYDQAESDTGNFNFTRAQLMGARPPAAPARERGRSDPALDSVSRRWFDGVRASLGPTVPAVLPADRMPARQAGPRPARPADSRPAAPELEAAVRPMAELPSAEPRRPVAELTAGPTVAPPAVPQPRQEAVPALPAAAPEPKQAPLRRSKEQSQRKIAAASELLYRYTARQTSAPRPALAALPSQLPWQEQAEQTGRAAEEAWRLQQPTVLDLGVPAAVEQRMQPSAVDTGVPAAEEWRMRPSVLDTGVPVVDDWRTQPSVLDTGVPAVEDWRARPSVPDTGIPQAGGWTVQPSVLDTGVPAVGAPTATKADRAIDFARAQIGRPCLWGAVGPESYDNAGLTQAAWRAAGVTLPRTTYEQASAGTVIPLADSRPGDLIFFNDNFSHVGLCTGNGLMIHAPGPGAVIREDSVNYAGEAAVRIAVRPA